MVPRALFEELGGFDERYLPAYCEDTDLALKIRASGLSVVYQPMSVVTHYEGITSGTDLKSGVKAYQVTNTRKLHERWSARLAKHEPNGVNVDRAKDRGVTRRALVFDHCTPTPDQDAGSLVTANVLRLLSQMGFQVTFIPEDNFLYMPPYTTDLQRVGIEVLYYPFQRTVLEHLREYGDRYDLVLLWRPAVADRHLKDLKTHCPRAKLVYGAADLHFLRMMREADLTKDPELRASAQLMKASELDTMGAVDAVLVHSTAEERIVQEEVPGSNVHVFPLIMGTRRAAPPLAGRGNTAFVGGFQHEPNIDAVEFFVAEVLPLVRNAHPEIKFFAIGSKVPDRIKSLASEYVIVTGLVHDLAPLLDTIRVGVAPLRYGAGAKGKVATALSLGLPMVVTPVAAEGMALVHGEHVLVGSDPVEIAEHVGRLCTDDALWARLSASGLVYADKTFGPSAARACMDRVLGSAGVRGGAVEQAVSDRWIKRPRERGSRSLRLLDSTGRPDLDGA
jgi:glycosyltransferase involved in cell wall biosynthesis